MATLSPKTTILNVDDHEINRYTKSQILRKAGYEVKEAATGSEALQVVHQEHPPLVLLDVHLPDINGLEVCQRIKNDPALASTLILQISASSITSQDRVRGLEGGADIYLTEPVEPGELIAQVRALLRLYQTEQALAHMNETLEQQVQERASLLQLLHEILAAVNEVETVEAVLQFTLDQICTYTGWPVGHVYWLDRQRPGELISSKIWHLDKPERFEPFRQVAEAARFCQGQGLPGQVLASGELNWVVDVAQLDPQRAPAAVQSGLQNGFGFPLWVNEEIEGVLEFYTSKAVEPDGAFLEVMTQIGVQLGRVVERRRAEDQLRRMNTELEQGVSKRTAQLEVAHQEIRRANERFAIAEKAVKGFVYEYDQETGLVERSPNFTAVSGYEPHETESTIEWWISLLHPDDREKVINTTLRAGQETVTKALEYRVRHRDGYYLYLWDQCQIIRNEAGQITRLIGAAIDINERKRVEEALIKSEGRFRAVQELSLDAFTILKAIRTSTGQIVDFEWEYLNSAAEQILRYSKDELIGRRLLEVLPGIKTESDLFERYIRVVETGQPHDIELTYNAEGIKGWFRNMTVKLDDGVAVSFSDITRRKRADLGERLLAQAGKILTGSLDYRVQLTNIADLVVPHLADWCIVDLYDEDWTVHPIALAHLDPAKVKRVNEMRRRYPPDRTKLREEAWLWQKGQAGLYPEITEAMLEAKAQDAEHYQLLRDLQLCSAMVVPLVGRERVLGIIAFVWAESGNRYDEHDLALAEELTQRMALAVDNTYAYTAEQQARQVAEEMTERMVSLQTVTAALSRALTSQQIFKVILQNGLAALRADSGAILLMTEDGTVLESVGAVGYAEAVLKNFQVHSLSLHSMLSEAIHTGQLVWVRSHAEYTARYPHLASTRAATQPEASAVAPLLLENQVLGVIMFSFIEVHDFSPEEKDFVVALTSLCAQALERARLYEVEQRARAEAEANQQRLVLLAEMHERNRLGQELHDTVAQALGYLNLKLSMMNNMLADHQFDLIAADLPELKKVVSETYTDVREEIFNLRAKALSAMSFMELLQRYIDKYHRFYNLDIQLIQEIDPALFEFPAEISSQLIRTIQEALINIRKHSHVSTANIRLGCRKDGQLCIVIEDQGQGFDMAKVKEKTSSFGLQIMRERVEGVGGSLEVETSPGKGTRVILCYHPKNQDLNSLAGSDCNKR